MTMATTPFSVGVLDAPRYIEDAAYVEASLEGLARRPLFRRPLTARRVGNLVDLTI